MSKKNPVDDLYNVAKKVQKTRLLNNYTNLLDEWSVDELTFDELTWHQMTFGRSRIISKYIKYFLN